MRLTPATSPLKRNAPIWMVPRRIGASRDGAAEGSIEENGAAESSKKLSTRPLTTTGTKSRFPCSEHGMSNDADEDNHSAGGTCGGAYARGDGSGGIV